MPTQMRPTFQYPRADWSDKVPHAAKIDYRWRWRFLARNPSVTCRNIWHWTVFRLPLVLMSVRSFHIKLGITWLFRVVRTPSSSAASSRLTVQWPVSQFIESFTPTTTTLTWTMHNIGLRYPLPPADMSLPLPMQCTTHFSPFFSTYGLFYSCTNVQGHKSSRRPSTGNA